MKLRMSSLISSSFFHCSLYKVTGNRPSPYTETPPFSLTFRLIPLAVPFFRLAFSARSRSISLLRSSESLPDIDVPFHCSWIAGRPDHKANRIATKNKDGLRFGPLRIFHPFVGNVINVTVVELS